MNLRVYHGCSRPLGEWLAYNMLVESTQASSQTQVSCQLEPQLHCKEIQENVMDCLDDTSSCNHNAQPDNEPINHIQSVSSDTDLSTSISASNPTEVLGKQVNLDEIFEELECKLSKTIEDVVKSAMSTLKSSLEFEIKQLVDKVENLSSRVLELEKTLPLTKERASVSLAGPQNCTSNSLEIDSIQSQIRQLAVSVSNQRLREQKERESKANNMVVLGPRKVQRPVITRILWQ